MIASVKRTKTYFVWKTTDGKEFETLAEASEHEGEINYNKFEDNNEEILEIIKLILNKYFKEEALVKSYYSVTSYWIGTEALAKKILKELYLKDCFTEKEDNSFIESPSVGKEINYYDGHDEPAIDPNEWELNKYYDYLYPESNE